MSELSPAYVALPRDAEPSEAGQIAPAGPGAEHAAVLGRALERLANELFSGVPAAAIDPELGSAVPVLGGPAQPAPAAPPSGVLPSALSLGGAGISPGSGWTPPTPGFLQQPPPASSPAPKESDLRTLPAMLSEGLGVSSPVALASSHDPAPHSPPYFLELAGLPKAGPTASPSSLVIPAASDARAPTGLDRGARRVFDPNSVRRDFPILSERVHGKQLVWLDNAATTQKPRAVIERISYFYEHENSNIHRAAHTLAARATDAYEGARESTRRFLSAPSKSDIIFVRGTTEAINLVAQSWGRRHLQSGDEVVISWLEHHANIVPWQQICLERGARLRVAPVDDRGQVLLDDYERVLGPRTKLVALSHVSNALGTIVPVAEMVAMAHRHGAKVLVDGAQAVSHLRVDVQALDCDFYVFSGHKIFGPTGIGALFGKADVLESMPPWQGGGNMIRDVTFERTMFHAPPARFEAGTPNIADAVGLGAALDYVGSLGIENISRYEHDLLGYATERLVRVPGLTLFGTAPDKAGVLSFVIAGLATEEVGGALDREGIAVRAGHHCAQPILRRFGVESTVRASLAPYNTCDDIDALVAALLRMKASGN